MSDVKFYNARAPWTVAEESELAYMFNVGRSLSQISAKMGRTERAIVVRLERLGYVEEHMGRVFRKTDIWAELSRGA